MKLRTKFSLLVFLLAIVTITVSLYLLANFRMISKVHNFQTELQQTRFDFQNILTFSDRVRSRGVDVDSLAAEWRGILKTLDDDFYIIENDVVRNRLDSETAELAEGCLNSWKSIRGQMNLITEYYDSISKFDYSFMLKNTIRTSGFTTGIQNYRDTENLTSLEYEINSLENELATIDYVYENFNTTFASITDQLEKFVAHAQSQFFTLAIIVSIVAAIIVSILSYVLISKLLDRFKKIQTMATKLSERDLTFKADEKDNDEASALVHTLNDTIGILNDFFVVVKKTAESAKSFGQSINASALETAAATHQINSNIESLGNQFNILDTAVNKTVNSLSDMSNMIQVLLVDNEKQFTLLNESSSAIDEIATTIAAVNTTAMEKARSAAEIQNLVADGDEKMEAASNLLSDITSQLDEIDEIITLINSIAEQTNILSMNAAIESAHAGDAGKGFSVVAEEIRILAESTSENAKRISSAIYAIVNNVHLANRTNNEAALAFNRVSEQAKDMMHSLYEITESVQNVDNKSKLITVGTKEVASSAQKINSYCEKISSQQNIVSAEMDKMRQIFISSLQGMDEIKIGTNDISRRMTEVSDMSSESCNKMEELGASLDEFRTADNSFEYLEEL